MDVNQFLLLLNKERKDDFISHISHYMIQMYVFSTKSSIECIIWKPRLVFLLQVIQSVCWVRKKKEAGDSEELDWTCLRSEKTRSLKSSPLTRGKTQTDGKHWVWIVFYKTPITFTFVRACYLLTYLVPTLSAFLYMNGLTLYWFYKDAFLTLL